MTKSQEAARAWRKYFDENYRYEHGAVKNSMLTLEDYKQSLKAEIDRLFKNHGQKVGRKKVYLSMTKESFHNLLDLVKPIN